MVGFLDSPGSLTLSPTKNSNWEARYLGNANFGRAHPGPTGRRIMLAYGKLIGSTK
ncbi:MAG: hypothetical protein OK457_10500 [Thaumarchaeota archaeon]|nr:hypothetical protein [Nitrososphaerota archaeon]